MTAIATEPGRQASPARKARIGGVCWLLCFLTSLFPLIVSSRLVIPRDAATTAANLLANEGLFRLGTAALLLSTAFYVGATLFVYEVLKPANRSISLLAAFFSLVGCAVGALSCIFDLAPFILLKGTPYLAAFTTEQLQGVSYAILALRVQANDTGLFFFGLHCLGVGYLVLRSTFMPPVIGALMLFAGLGWLTFLFPPVAHGLAPFNLLPGGIGELSLSLWLIIKGVRAESWHAQALAAG
ncbi:MAG TPA: DUF4386 domain-containing protein [Chthoniobacterales bacterium]|nr:DUF4386 domain-containing protein [Chthoniobacterales bacterium]